MPNQQINSITSATTTDGSELLPVVSGGVTKSVSVSTINSGIAADAVSDVYEARDLAVGQSSIAAAAALAAGSIAQQDLSAVSAALHRSPNAVTSMFVYDTTKDSDGGAWTEKCQHTSWYNEGINGKWLGAQDSELHARAAGGTYGPETTTNGNFDTDSGWQLNNTIWSSGRYTISDIGGSDGAITQQLTNVTSGTLLQVTVVIISNTSAGSGFRLRQGNQAYNSIYGDSIAASGFTGVWSFFIVAGQNNPWVTLLTSSSSTSVVVDSISIRAVPSTFITSSGDYFQLTTDGKFYRLWKNLLKYSEQFDNAAWTKSNLNPFGSGSVANTISTTDPLGGNNADFIQEDQTNNQHILSYISSVQSGTYTATVYLKAAGRNFVKLQPVGGGFVFFNLSTGQIGTQSGAVGSISNAGNGWYRCSVTTTYASNYTFIILADSDTGTQSPVYTGNGTSGIYVWGAQLEYGSIATTYEAKTTDGTTTEVFRGNKREFPKQAAIVAEASNVTIYDLTESGRPMWKRILRGGLVSAVESCLWTYGSAGAYEYNFALDSNTQRSTAADSYGLALYPFKASGVNPITNLIHVSAVLGTWGGAWLIHPTRSVSITMGTGANKLIFLNEKFLGIGHAYVGQPSYVLFADPFTLTASSTAISTINVHSDYLKYPDFVRLIDPAGRQFKDQIAFFKSAAIQVAKQNFNNFRKGISATITDTYNTGHMVGDIRRTYLADTAVGSVYSPALTMQNMITTAQQGVWYDPSDITTLYRDAAGTQPVTAVEQPVGLMLDKRDTAYSTYFDGAGDYLTAPASSALNLTTGSWTIEGWFYGTSFPNFSNNILVKDGISGSTYPQYTLRVTSGSKLIGEIGSGTSSNSFQTLTGTTTVTANAWHHFAFTFDGSLLRLFLDGAQEISAAKTVTMGDGGAPLTIGAQNNNPNNYFNGYISNLRIVKGTALYTANFTPPASPLTAVTGTSLLTCGTTWSGNPAITTVGNTRADKLNPFTTGTGNHAFNSSGNSANFPVLSARYNQYLSTETLATQNVTTVAASYKLAFTGTGSITLSGTATGTYSAGTHTITCTAGTLTSTVSGTVTQADLRVANDGASLPYQRVNTATDYDSDPTKFPRYLKFNGSSTSMQTASIDFTSTDKMFVCAGVRKLSDVGLQFVFESSSDVTANQGAIALTGPDPWSGPAKYEFISRGSVISATATTSASYSAPITNILTGLGSIAGGLSYAKLRINSYDIVTNSADQGSVKYGTYPIYIGARAGSNYWFNGRLYQLVIVNKTPTADELKSTETTINRKTLAYAEQ